MTELPPQQELRKRIKAAIELGGFSGYPDLAEHLDYSAGLLKALGAGRDAKERHLREIARVCGLPYAWFTLPDIAEAITAYALTLDESSNDPATRFEARAKREARRQAERPATDPASRPDEDAGGEGQ